MSKEVPSYTIWWLNKISIVDKQPSEWYFLIEPKERNFLIHDNGNDDDDKDNNSILINAKQ